MLFREIIYVLTEAIKVICCTVLLILGGTKHCKEILFRPWFLTATIVPLMLPLLSGLLGLVYWSTRSCCNLVWANLLKRVGIDARWKKFVLLTEVGLGFFSCAWAGFGLGVILEDLDDCDAKPIAIAAFVLLVCLCVRLGFIRSCGFGTGKEADQEDDTQ